MRWRLPSWEGEVSVGFLFYATMPLWAVPLTLLIAWLVR